MENIGIAFELLGVGMITVFTILFLVVITGGLIIRFVNKYLPEEEAAGPGPATPLTTDPDPGKVAAIAGAINILTGGRGRITRIERR